MTAPQLASRVMKARRESMCPHCRQPVRVGQRIAKVPLGWLHVACVVARLHGDDQEDRQW